MLPAAHSRFNESKEESCFQRGMSLGMRFGSIIGRIVIGMNEQRLNGITQLRAFLQGFRAPKEVRFDPFGRDSSLQLLIVHTVLLSWEDMGACTL